MVVVDGAAREVDWLALRDRAYQPVEQSSVIDLGPAAELVARVDWSSVTVERDEG